MSWYAMFEDWKLSVLWQKYSFVTPFFSRIRSQWRGSTDREIIQSCLLPLHTRIKVRCVTWCRWYIFSLLLLLFVGRSVSQPYCLLYSSMILRHIAREWDNFFLHFNMFFSHTRLDEILQECSNGYHVDTEMCLRILSLEGSKELDMDFSTPHHSVANGDANGVIVSERGKNTFNLCQI